MTATSTDTYDQVGIREDLSDAIYNVTPTEVPFFSNCAKKSVSNTYFEHQTDSLANVSASTAVEGADASFAPAASTTRVGNYTEIISKTAIVSGTVEATNRAGRTREMAYQVMKRAKEARRDVEHHLVGIHNAKAVGDAATARETASYVTWFGSDATTDGRLSVGVTGAAGTGDGSDTPTPGTARPFTETLLGEVIDGCWNAGGNPNIIMLGSHQKRVLNGFAGNSDSRDINATGKRIINAISVYESDYGTMNVVPNRFCKSTDVLVYEQDYWKIAVLRPMQSKEIARTGDAEKRQILMEYGLCAANSQSSGAILALND